MAADHIRILLGLILAGIIACAAFILNRISLDALKAAILAGTFAFGLGGFQVATALVLFFVTSVLLSDLPGKVADPHGERPEDQDRKSTRLNSSHVAISYAVVGLKKKITDSH